MLFLILTRKFNICLVACLAGLALFGDRAVGADFDLAETAGTLRIWHHDDALPSDSVTAIVQTHDGFLWVGTSAGLVWFDGVKFTGVNLGTFAVDHPVYVTALCEDSDGNLWIGTQQDGLFQLIQGRVKHFGRQQGLLDDGATSLAAGNRGQVWIGSKSGLNLWAGQQFKSFTTADGLSDDLVSGVNVARSGIVWITTRTGMCRFMEGRITPYLFQTESQGRRPEYLGTYEDRRGNLWAFGDTYLINLAEGKRFNYFRSSESASVRIWSLCEGQDGRIWIGTSGRGLFCFQDNHFQPVILGENRWPYDVRAIYEDREGNLWLGTSGGGLVQLRPQSIAVVSEGQGLPNSSPTALALGNNRKIYAGLQRGGLFVGEAGRFEQVDSNERSTVQNFISSVAVAGDGTVWAGTLGDGIYGLKEGREIHFTTENGLGDDTVLAVCVDAEGGVWASTEAGTVHRFNGPQQLRFDTTQGLSGAPVTAMIAAADGGLWLGSLDGQLLREENGKITDIEGLKNLEGFPVLALHEGQNGQLWIGTSGGGLACLIRGAMINWNTNSGLPNNTVAGVVEDKARNLWLATGAGIYRVNQSDVSKSMNSPGTPLVCKLMSTAKTLPESTTVSGGTRAVLSPEGQLWFATSEGVMKADSRQTASEPAQIPLYLESAVFNGQPPLALLQGGIWSPKTARPQPFLAPVDLRSLEIYFTGLNFAAPGELRFRHKLEGFDSDWVDDADARSVRYGKLTYGHYRFRVAVCSVGGSWQEAADAFAFVVPTPFYLQKWAIFLFALAAIALVAGIVRLVSHRRLRSKLVRLEQQQSLERERMRIARDMHDEMGSKLTKISFLSEHAQVDAAAIGPLGDKIESIAKASRELLQTMDEIVWVVNPRNDTLENLVVYLSHYAVEYFQNTTIECELSLPREIPDLPSSSELRHNLFLAFEETLNNVLKHSGATKVKVVMNFPTLGLEIKVVDNGKGFNGAPTPENFSPRRSGGGNGLNNMRQRLQDVGGECLIAGDPGRGTTVTMRINLNSRNKK